ncbi:MAG: MauE/DoxX family redox-associated membrane protein [Pseudomonadota bacterium]
MNNHLKAFFSNPWVELICRWSLGVMFIVASFHKMINPAQFAKIIYGYQLVPGIAINLIAIILPFLELFSGAALVAGIFPRSAATIINVMMLTFIVAISINLLRGHAFDCGCFSMRDTNHPSAAASLLVRDLVCLVAGGYVMMFRGNPKFCKIR